MSRYRRLALTLSAAAACAVPGVAVAISLSGTTAATSDGTLTIDRTLTTDGAGYVYAVRFDGTIAEHGWSHAGLVSGTSTAYMPYSYYGQLLDFPVSSEDGSVTGECGGQISDPTGAPPGSDSPQQGDFDCVLAHDGGTQWQLNLHSALSGSTSNGVTHWEGPYAAVDAEPFGAVTGVQRLATYGDVQFTEHTTSQVQYGPLRLSGQVAIGHAVFVGDLVGTVSDWVSSNQIPAFTLSGASGSHTVTGTCTGTMDDTAGPAATFSCSLTFDRRPAEPVSLHATFTSTSGRVGDREGWDDYSGGFAGG